MLPVVQLKAHVTACNLSRPVVLVARYFRRRYFEPCQDNRLLSLSLMVSLPQHFPVRYKIRGSARTPGGRTCRDPST